VQELPYLITVAYCIYSYSIFTIKLSTILQVSSKSSSGKQYKPYKIHPKTHFPNGYSIRRGDNLNLDPVHHTLELVANIARPFHGPVLDVIFETPLGGEVRVFPLNIRFLIFGKCLTSAHPILYNGDKNWIFMLYYTVYLRHLKKTHYVYRS